jgi:catalase-peroxidase
MVRLAWHCNGSYRLSDGRGGCDGGRIRFAPELDWEDNVNIDKALKLLEPIKEKYGSSLSWGDLITLTGTTAIEFMGGPVLGFCGGRIDDIDGSESLILGPSEIQEQLSPCKSIGKQGACPSPLGPTTIGEVSSRLSCFLHAYKGLIHKFACFSQIVLQIYVNPEGPVNATGDPVASAVDIRDIFGRMGFNDTETVALIGGGHAFGKVHGACPSPPCGEGPLRGIGNNTWTSGFEGPWTTKPTEWSNEFFFHLLTLDWEIGIGPGGKLQWDPIAGMGAHSQHLDVMMLTTDIALRDDPDYLPIAQEFLDNITSLDTQFAYAWYKLVSRDLGPRERCINENPDDIPPAQSWQYPLPTPEVPETPVDYIGARVLIQEMIDSDRNYIAGFSHLALRCASTFRATDYRGGCNGARVRHAPESGWPENAGTHEVLHMLQDVKETIQNISWADLIVLAGQTALESAGNISLNFCGGRVDALDGAGSEELAPRYYTPAVVSIRDDMAVKGLNSEEGVALFAMPSAEESMIEIGRSIPHNVLSNKYFIDLLAEDGDFDEYDLALLEDEFLPIVQLHASDNDHFLEVFSAAWTKLMNADRYDGPFANVCDNRIDITLGANKGENSTMIGELDGAHGDDMEAVEKATDANGHGHGNPDHEGR